MKASTAIKFVALFTAAGYPCVALAQSFGAPLPTFLTAGIMFNVFCGALVALTVIADYTRHQRVLARVCSAAAPAPAARRAEAHRLAA
ncbi:MAG TPA: hypothetical protein VHE13_06300 [Opitutus sp.]|nr:hypothetical protein [Opitutus sp.]